MQAATIFQQVWSSEAFRAAVLNCPPLIYQDGKINGPELYKKLIASPAKVMNLSVNNRYRECARTDPGWANTLVHRDYLDYSQTAAADLVNTLSHECTHYSDTGESWDAGNDGNWNAYVSYGIGCLTQNLSGQGKTCAYAPGSSPLEKAHTQPRFPEHAPGGAWRRKK